MCNFIILHIKLPWKRNLVVFHSFKLLGEKRKLPTFSPFCTPTLIQFRHAAPKTQLRKRISQWLTLWIMTVFVKQPLAKPMGLLKISRQYGVAGSFWIYHGGRKWNPGAGNGFILVERSSAKWTSTPITLVGVTMAASPMARNPRGLRPLGFWPWDLPRHSIHHDTPWLFQIMYQFPIHW